MPSFAEGNPEEFWQASDLYERKNGRVCSSLVVALPKELTSEQRIELAEQFIQEFADRYRYPFTARFIIMLALWWTRTTPFASDL
jgi:hypothetical protein